MAVSVERVTEAVLPSCTVPRLDALLATQAAAVFFAGDSEAVPGQPGFTYVYFPPLVVGPFRAQTRLTCEVRDPSPGRAEVNVSEVNIGVMDFSGQAKYQEDPSELLDAKSTVVLRWQQLGDGVRVSVEAAQRLLIKVPAWFPVPDAAFGAIVRPFVDQSIRSGQAEVIQRLRGLLG